MKISHACILDLSFLGGERKTLGTSLCFLAKYGDVISIRLTDSSDNDVYQWRERFSKLKTTWFFTS